MAVELCRQNIPSGRNLQSCLAEVLPGLFLQSNMVSLPYIFIVVMPCDTFYVL